MVITADNRTLIDARSYGRRPTGFDVSVDSALCSRRVWAPLGDGVPDGICVDVDGAVWYAGVPNNAARECAPAARCFSRPRSTVDAPRAGSANPSERPPFVVASEWRRAEEAPEVAQVRTGRS
ncbi:MAG: SMP-30/gluconolactonase/LRE family protein [Hyphomicrobiaceae bacterium]|nr:SMP-30/gluconolactonase/LRE family protein [Hyphomicrobiaceae bacterium]